MKNEKQLKHNFQGGKVMKKISTLFMSLLIIAVTMTSSLTNAAFNSNKDPNGDGTLDSSDDVYITQYLVGHHEPQHLHHLM